MVFRGFWAKVSVHIWPIRDEPRANMKTNDVVLWLARDPK